MEYLILYSNNHTQPEHQWTLLTTEGECPRPGPLSKRFPPPLSSLLSGWVSTETATEVCSRRSRQKLLPGWERQVFPGPLPSPALQATPTQFTNPALPGSPAPQETSSVLRSTASRATLGTSSRWGHAQRWGLGPSLACRMSLLSRRSSQVRGGKGGRGGLHPGAAQAPQRPPELTFNPEVVSSKALPSGVCCWTAALFIWCESESLSCSLMSDFL